MPDAEEGPVGPFDHPLGLSRITDTFSLMFYPGDVPGPIHGFRMDAAEEMKAEIVKRWNFYWAYTKAFGETFEAEDWTHDEAFKNGVMLGRLKKHLAALKEND